MKGFKSLKVILILFVGFCVLSLLAFAASLTIFRTVSSGTDSGVVEDNNPTVEGSVGSPDYSGKGVVGAPSDLIYPVPGGTGGDGSKLIKSASLGIKVANFDSAQTDIKNKVTNVKGFVQYLSDTGTLNNRSVSLIVRVPEDKFEESITYFKSIATEVVSNSEGSDDISEVYKDYQSRLKGLKALEKQYLVLLERASKMEDIIAIQKELASVRDQIEMYQTQLKNYDTQVKMSSISITLSQASENIDVVGNTWKLEGVTKEAFAALVDFGKGLLTITVWAAVFSPVVLIPAGIVWLVAKGGKKKGKK